MSSIDIIDKIIELLTNQEEHTEVEIKEKLDIEEEKLRKILNFLKKYKFISYLGNGRIKISPEIKSLFLEEH